MSNSRPKSALLASVAFLALWSTAAAEPQFGFGADAGGGERASAKLYVRTDGETVRVAIPIEIEEHWHLYHEDLGYPDAVGLPTEVTFDAPGAVFGRVHFPEPKRYAQPGVGAGGRDTWILGHEGSIVLYALGKIEDAALFDVGSMTVEVQGLTCKDGGACIPFGPLLEVEGEGPDALFAAFPADVLPPGAEPRANPARAPPPEVVAGGARDWSAVTFGDYRPREGLSAAAPVTRGILFWLALAFLAGAILNVMPCVLPVISIKVLSFVQQAGEDRRRVLHLGLAFAAGIVVVFWALAIVAIVAGLTWGEHFQSEAFLVTMIGIVFALALSLFGVFELGVPSGVGGLAGIRREGLGDAFFKGMLATLLATPCSGPFLGSTLTWTLAQPAATVLAIFTALGFGMAVPYVILTAQPVLLKRLPKPGPWMDTFKHAMGFVLLATVLFLLVSVPQHMLLFTVTFMMCVALAAWWYGHFATFDKPKWKRLAHLAVAFAIAGGGARFSFVEFRSAFVVDTTAWVAFDPELMEEHLAAGRHVFVDFTADWCFNCKVNEKYVFDSGEVRAAMAERGVVAMKADITHGTPYSAMVRRLMGELGSSSIPFLAVFPADRPDEPIIERDLVTKSTMLRIFESLPPAP